MTPFDLIHTPLKGVSLIEAAAGTGKTYTIEGLYIRLVLEKQLPVERILVVTFTRAATAELRDRIYRRLAKARDAFAGAPVEDDELLRHAAARHPNPVQAGRLLRQALMDFDRAAIFTIHGFCQRVLYENAFETASAFNAELLQDQTPILVEVVEDFWRQWVCDQPPEFLQFARGTLGDPGRLLELARKSTAADFAVTPRRDEPCLRDETLAAFRRRLEQLGNCWRAGRDDVGRILLEAPLNGTSYGTLTPGENGGPSKRQRMVRSLLEGMDAYFAHGTPNYPPVAAVAKLAASSLAGATLRRLQTPSHPVFDACEAVHQAAPPLLLEMTGQLQHLKWRLLCGGQAELERRKSEKGLVSFDDLLRRVARALDTAGGEELAGAVRERYQAALVDEFQDTDDLQYAVFSRLFSAPQHLLFMIGDPKQAIYGFRGADIFIPAGRAECRVAFHPHPQLAFLTRSGAGGQHAFFAIGRTVSVPRHRLHTGQGRTGRAGGNRSTDGPVAPGLPIAPRRRQGRDQTGGAVADRTGRDHGNPAAGRRRTRRGPNRRHRRARAHQQPGRIDEGSPLGGRCALGRLQHGQRV